MDKTKEPQASANEQQNQPKVREPYEPPAIISEEVFESLALTCGKGSGFACRVSGGGLNS